ncbi:rutC family protein UK114-like isoform X1 [Bradysia coprophila]|uniref:rutC family protein UK114-like isoform X1 n=1 Tax=Bradysia coprophila TaxID=38358 RepID=UPI00187D80EA|nr:rutC family protein UK114-like isoform X1 [Bradysia coprophila]
MNSLKIIRKIISSSKAPRVAASPYNQAVIADRTVYVSGCLGLDKDTMTLMPGGAVPEMAKALENLQAVLAAAGSGVDKVVKATIFVEDMGDFANINEEYKKVFTKDFPARSCVQVAKLPMNAKVEIEVVALTGEVETVSV